MNQGDSEAPTWPTATLTESSLTSTSVSLTWSGATDNEGVNGYRVRLNGAVVADVIGETAEISGLTPDTSNDFSVQAYDLAGNESNGGPTLQVSTPADNTLPSWTDGVVTVGEVTRTSVALQWSGASDNVAVVGYEIELDGSVVGLSLIHI